MSFRVVVVSSSSKLDLKMNYLVVRNSEIKKVLISEIAVLILESTAISITSALLCELIKSKVKVVFCDEKRNPISELIPYYGSHDASLKIKIQSGWKDVAKQKVWTNIVTQKITKQMELLELLGLNEAQLLRKYINEIEHNDSTNREAHSAKVYFNALFTKKFKRKEENNINTGLDYGYSILLSAFNREIVAQGYVTTMGVFHDNQYNQFNLSCDLMEAFRPIVDRKVYEMDLTKFELEEKLQLVNLLNSQVIIDNQKCYLLNAIKIYVRSVIEVLNENGNVNIKEYRNEL